MQSMELYAAISGYGRSGVLSEHFCRTDGLTIETLPGGKSSSLWFSYNGGAAVNVLEALLWMIETDSGRPQRYGFCPFLAGNMNTLEIKTLFSSSTVKTRWGCLSGANLPVTPKAASNWRGHGFDRQWGCIGCRALVSAYHYYRLDHLM